MRAGICTPVWKNVRFHCEVSWMARVHVRGVVIGRHILFREAAKDVPQFLFRHELEHCYQQIRDGRFLFYLKYFYYQLRYGYQKNPYEIEAREMALAPLTSIEEELLCRLREESPK